MTVLRKAFALLLCAGLVCGSLPAWAQLRAPSAAPTGGAAFRITPAVLSAVSAQAPLFSGLELPQALERLSGIAADPGFSWETRASAGMLLAAASRPRAVLPPPVLKALGPQGVAALESVPPLRAAEMRIGGKEVERLGTRLYGIRGVEWRSREERDLQRQEKVDATRGSASDAIKVLFEVRHKVQLEARKTLRSHLGGDVGDGRLHRDVRRVLRRLTSAAGLPNESAQVFVGNSFLPNAFTTILQVERDYMQRNASLAKAFRISSIFISLGLLRAVENEDQLAFVLAHELMHNRKGHLKDFQGTHQVLGHFHELEADAEALKLLAAAGYDPEKAVDSLYALEAAYKKIEGEYSLLKRDRGDLAMSLQRLRDIHPHNDVRRANMLEHMDEAAEARKPPPPSRNPPIWTIRRNSTERPTHIDRFEARLRKAAVFESLEEGLRAVERFVARERAKKSLAEGDSEKYAIVEEAYRTLMRRAVDSEELRAIEVSLKRQKNRNFPSKRLRSDITTRQLELLRVALGGRPSPDRAWEPRERRRRRAAQAGRREPTLEDFLRASGALSVESRRAGALRLLGSIRSRRELDAAAKALSIGAESLGLDPGPRDLTALSLKGKEDHLERWRQVQFDVSQRLWKAVRRILSEESGRPAKPEEILSELHSRLSPSWLAQYQLGFQVEILDSATGAEPFRSERYRPSQLAALLAGLDPLSRRKTPFERGSALAGALEYWELRHHLPHAVAEKNGKILHRYERFYLKGRAPPGAEDALDILFRFGRLGAVPPAMVRLYRGAGGLQSLLTRVLEARAAFLKTALEEANGKAARRGAVKAYAEFAKNLLDSSLYGLKDFESIRESAATVWASAKKVLESDGSLGEADRSGIADMFFDALEGALRRAVVQANTAGVRPKRATMTRFAGLLNEMDAMLRPFPSGRLLRGYAANLYAHLHLSDRTYMAAYRLAVPFRTDDPFWHRVRAYYSFRGRLAFWRGAGAARVPGVPPDRLRPLKSRDFVQFIALSADPSADSRTKLMAAALLDRLDQGHKGNEGGGRVIGMRADAAVGRWLLEDAVEAARGKTGVRALAKDMLRLSDLHPGLLQPELATRGSAKNAFRQGATYVRRSETYRSLAKQEHPFRGVNVRWAHEMLDRLDRAGAWPKSTEDRLDLLDFLNTSGEFSDRIDGRIVKFAKDDPEGFRRWLERDRRRLPLWEGGRDPNLESIALDGAFAGVEAIPAPKAYSLRIVRNPALRAELFDLLPEARYGEKPPRRKLRKRLGAWWRLWRAYRGARAYYSPDFLKGLQHEGALEDKMFEILEETDRIAQAKAEALRRRWDAGRFQRGDFQYLAGNDLAHEWAYSSAHKRDQAVEAVKRSIHSRALASLLELYNAYAKTQEPLLGILLENYPEPTRSRDALLEKIIKARRLSPGGLAFLESHKSYRMPNPLRIVEKHLLDQAVVHLKRFSPEERVDLILHMGGIERLSDERLKAFDRRALKGDRKKLARDRFALRSLSQLENYLSLMHPIDRGLLLRTQFYGETSLHDDPEQIRRLFEKLTIEGRELPPLVEKVVRTYFEILTEDEKARLLSDLASQETSSKTLSGPEVVKVALNGLGVTGAKVAQVLATHKGLIPDEYARALESFKDRAQDLSKILIHGIIRNRMEGILGGVVEAAALPSDEALLAMSREAVPRGVNAALRRRLVNEVKFLLREQGRRIRWIEAMGPELGSGSIKVVYKITLEDGGTWVVKVRAPGAAHRTRREFEILEKLVERLGKQEDLSTPGADQLLDEAKGLVRAEMDFNDEARKQSGMRARAKVRPWYAPLLAGRAPKIARPHPVYVGEDILIEEFMPTIRFADLPGMSLFGPSKRSIAKRAVDEGMLAMILEEHLEPDPHTGNRQAKRGRLLTIGSRMVLMDVGQEVRLPIERVKPLMKAGLALESGDLAAAADRLLSIVEVPEKTPSSQVRREIGRALLRRSKDGLVERLMEGLIAAEKQGALVKPEYGALEKAFLIYTGYSEQLPKDYIFRALERAAMVRLIRDRPASLPSLAWLFVRKTLFGRASVRPELERLIDRLRSNLPNSGDAKSLSSKNKGSRG